MTFCLLLLVFLWKLIAIFVESVEMQFGSAHLCKQFICFDWKWSSAHFVWLSFFCNFCIGHNVPVKDTTKYVQDGTTGENGNVHETTETERETNARRAGGLRQPMARKHSTKNDSVHLQRRVRNNLYLKSW